ncbi:MAG: metal ABC transporter ATP-binding protein [Clostridioides difficile]|nr:metal ABC transporter ATP-binding protein [Clostridioides difficile]
MNIISVKNLKFAYGEEQVFSNVNFNISRGDFVSIIGSNGAGKSTLIKLLLGELSPTGGEITLLGQNIKNFDKWTKIGYISQSGLSYQRYFPASAEEVVRANLYSKIGLFRSPKKEHYQRTRDALAMVGMQEYSKSLIGSMSGGQRQKILLARALVSNPEVMILDEPTTGVDEKSSNSFYNLLAELNRDKRLTILMITHDIKSTHQFVTKTMLLEDGVLKEVNN